MRIPQDVIAQLDPSGNWILSNVFSRDTIAIGAEIMEVLSVLQKDNEENLRIQYRGKKFTVWDIGYFSNKKGLLADPTPWIRDFKKWPDPISLDFNEIISFLEKKHILIRDEKKYRLKFGRKTSLLDTEHFGNFHEQLGQNLFLDRVDPGEWWVRQKFTPDYRALNETLYSAIQGSFLDNFFKKTFTKKHTVVDMGCGTGFYAKKMAKYAGSVIGVDPSEKYIRIAKKDSQRNTQFKIAEVGSKDRALDFIPDESVDAVFMSDALLFYFTSPDPRFHPGIKVLFKEIKRILKPGGRFFSLEPHGIFWLRQWLGEEERPFTILTEYINKQFKVTPNTSEIIKAYLKAGFVLKDMQELTPDPAYAKKDKRAFSFAKEFPLWWFFELGV